MFLDFDSPLSNDDFFSIVIMTFVPPGAEGRAQYLPNLIRSIHQYADMPFEIILHDDASPPAVREAIFSISNSVSTVVFNSGVNMGFSASANKSVALANSNYVLFLNDDTLFTRPFLRDLKQVLDTPYVGAAVPPRAVDWKENEGVWAVRDGHLLHLASNAKAPGHFAFHKDRWLETRGFPQVYCNGGDISWLYTLLRRGYFNATFFQPGTTDSVRNIDKENQFQYTSGGRVEYDQSYPHIFGIPDEVYKEQSILRKNRRYPLSHNQYLEPYGIHNIDSWMHYFRDASIPGTNNFDWEKMKQFGQDRWQEEVERDTRAFLECKYNDQTRV